MTQFQTFNSPEMHGGQYFADYEPYVLGGETYMQEEAYANGGVAMTPMDKAFCGANKKPKGKTLGTESQCRKKGQVRLYGLNKVEQAQAKKRAKAKAKKKSVAKSLGPIPKDTRQKGSTSAKYKKLMESHLELLKTKKSVAHPKPKSASLYKVSMKKPAENMTKKQLSAHIKSIEKKLDADFAQHHNDPEYKKLEAHLAHMIQAYRGSFHEEPAQQRGWDQKSQKASPAKKSPSGRTVSAIRKDLNQLDKERDQANKEVLGKKRLTKKGIAEHEARIKALNKREKPLYEEFDKVEKKGKGGSSGDTSTKSHTNTSTKAKTTGNITVTTTGPGSSKVNIRKGKGKGGSSKLSADEEYGDAGPAPDAWDLGDEPEEFGSHPLDAYGHFPFAPDPEEYDYEPGSPNPNDYPLEEDIEPNRGAPPAPDAFDLGDEPADFNPYGSVNFGPRSGSVDAQPGGFNVNNAYPPGDQADFMPPSEMQGVSMPNMNALVEVFPPGFAPGLSLMEDFQPQPELHNQYIPEYGGPQPFDHAPNYQGSYAYPPEIEHAYNPEADPELDYDPVYGLHGPDPEDLGEEPELADLYDLPTIYRTIRGGHVGDGFWNDFVEGFKRGADIVRKPLQVLSNIPGIGPAVFKPISTAVNFIPGSKYSQPSQSRVRERNEPMDPYMAEHMDDYYNLSQGMYGHGVRKRKPRHMLKRHKN